MLQTEKGIKQSENSMYIRSFGESVARTLCNLHLKKKCEKIPNIPKKKLQTVSDIEKPKPRIHQFTNFKCCKMSFKVKKQDFKMHLDRENWIILNTLNTY